MINRVIIAGRLVSDPTVTYSQSGTPIASFRLAYNRAYKVENKWKEEPHFFDVKAFGKTAEGVIERFSKGYMVLVEGRLVQERWEKDGQNHSKIKVVAERVNFVRKPIEQEEREEAEEDFEIEEETIEI